jgi:retinol dehydrogenase 12
MNADMSGIHAIVTGANSGIGRQTALGLAAAGAHVVLACRSQEKTEPVIADIRAQTGNDNIRCAALDLGDLKSVRAFAETWLSSDEPLHLLINNAGLAAQRGLTQSGFELQFGVNHLGHFLLTELLLPRLVDAAPARILLVASEAHYQAQGIPFDDLQQSTPSFAGFKEYSVSKLANVLYGAELARRLEDTEVSVASLHPGVVASNVWRRLPWPLDRFVKLFMISNEEGARTTLHCCVDPEVVTHSGAYWDTSKRKKPSRAARDHALQDMLTRQSRIWVDLLKGAPPVSGNADLPLDPWVCLDSQQRRRRRTHNKPSSSSSPVGSREVIAHPQPFDEQSGRLSSNSVSSQSPFSRL